ncbi:MAG: hypothetical protein IKA68_05355 [Clostridia bacterium]|nr:hypothetical protein [Clostridia bacterium]MBR2613453.1 hypothetical protein [Clostridia bacterium]
MSYTNREIYENALRLIGETGEDDLCSDYEERAPYVIASFCTQVSDVDKRIRMLEGLDAVGDFNKLYLDLDGNFPLCDKLLGCASLYLAAMLLSDNDYELADSFYDKYCDAIATLSASVGIASAAGDGNDGSTDAVSAICESIVERYFFD